MLIFIIDCGSGAGGGGCGGDDGDAHNDGGLIAAVSAVSFMGK